MNLCWYYIGNTDSVRLYRIAAGDQLFERILFKDGSACSRSSRSVVDSPVNYPISNLLWVNGGVARTATWRGPEYHAFYRVSWLSGHSTYRLGVHKLQDDKPECSFKTIQRLAIPVLESLPSSLLFSDLHIQNSFAPQTSVLCPIEP